MHVIAQLPPSKTHKMAVAIGLDGGCQDHSLCRSESPFHLLLNAKLYGGQYLTLTPNNISTSSSQVINSSTVLGSPESFSSALKHSWRQDANQELGDGMALAGAHPKLYSLVVRRVHGHWSRVPDSGQFPVPHHRQPSMDERFGLLLLGEHGPSVEERSCTCTNVP